MEAIKIQNLTKNYGKARGINHINLSIEEGEFFGFIGPNGAGKSTTIRTLLGLIHPTEGNAFIFGLDITKDKDKILEQVGYLPSDASFYSGMKVKELLKLSADLRKRNCDENARLLCERLQLDVNRKIEDLSFGNRKKVAIICALQHDPRLLILDEPTSGLDPLMQMEFFKILKERNENGVTIFLSSHILSEIQHNCSRAAIIKEGEIIVSDRIEELSKTKAKRITIRGDISSLPDLNGIQDKIDSDNSSSFLYSGEWNTLLHALAGCSITDLSIIEPDLEEIFYHYYKKEEEKL